jgi:hypothetical protein
VAGGDEILPIAAAVGAADVDCGTDSEGMLASPWVVERLLPSPLKDHLERVFHSVEQARVKDPFC